MRRKLAAGNWKMNGLKASLTQIDALAKLCPSPDCDVLICPPATLLATMAARCEGTAIRVGGQDCHTAPSGAHTGDIAATMLADAGATSVILGHSERRADHGEDNATVAAKTQAAWAAGLTAIICIGETLDDRDAGRTLDVVGGQLSGSVPDGATAEKTVIAYEPVWAIGTGRTASTDQIAEVHDFIRAELEKRFEAKAGRGIRILYGGSVNPKNAVEIFGTSNVDGGLVGGASLKAIDFAQIISAAG
jgi:triosephosphate isomerase